MACDGGKALKKQAAAGAIEMSECKGVRTEGVFGGKRMRIVVQTPKKAHTLQPPEGKEEYWFQLLRKSVSDESRPEVQLQMAAEYECIQKAPLQEDADLGSAEREYPNASVKPGETITILEAREVDGQIRVRCERGWTSIRTAADGSHYLARFQIGI